MKTEQEQFLTETACYLNQAVFDKIISLDDVVRKFRTIISVEHSLTSFMDKLRKTCDTAFQKLKYSSAKDKFIRKVIVNTLMEHIPESAEKSTEIKQTGMQKLPIQKSPTKNLGEQAMTKTLSFKKMLFYMNGSLFQKYDSNCELFDNEEDFWSYFDLEDTQKCVIPDSFRHNRANMEHALKFLMNWNSLENSEFKSFSGHAISYLAEVLQTGVCCGETVNCHNLISYLNYINWGGKDEYEQKNSEESICDFTSCFFRHYCKQIALYPPNSNNRKGYLTRMLINYLDGEYQAYTAHTHACIKSLNQGTY